MPPTKPLKKKHAARISTAVIPFFILCSFAFLALLDDLRLSIPALISVTAVVVILLAAYIFLCESFSDKNRLFHSPAVILCVAVIIRLFFVFQPVQLSDDIYRYYIDGSRTITGQSPYAEAPCDIEADSSYLAAILSKVNHPELITIYPPAAQLVFAAGAFFKSLAGIKGLLVFLDIGTCLLIILILKKRKRPVSRSVLYAWHPLPVLEIASSGHIDSAALFFICLSFFLSFEWRKERSTPVKKYTSGLSGFVFSGAFLVKLFPIVFFPVLFILTEKRDRLYFCSGFFAGCCLLTALFFPQILNAADTLETYTRNWEFSGFIFRSLRLITDSGDVSRLILSGCFALFVLLISFRFYTFKTGRQNVENNAFLSAFKSCYAISLCYLILTPTLHPWYALYVVLFLPFVPATSGITLSWAVFLGYYILMPYTILGIWEEVDHIPGLIFAAPVLAAALTCLLKNKSNGNGECGSF